MADDMNKDNMGMNKEQTKGPDKGLGATEDTGPQAGTQDMSMSMSGSGQKSECCSGSGETEKQSQREAADELLASADSKGMSLKEAEEIIADDSADEEKRMDAEELLAESDSKNMDLEQAEKIVMEENS